jgi:enoyl-CoA hydratase/carnithine racemase
MLLLGTEIDAATSRAWGLVHEIAHDVDRDLSRVVESLLACGPLALELAKEAIHRGSELPLRDGLRLEGDLNHQLAATEDRAEGLAAFFAKRPPDFSGR